MPGASKADVFVAAPAATITPVATAEMEAKTVATTGPTPAAGVSAATAEPLKPVPTAEVEPQLQALWDRLDKGSAPTNNPVFTWRRAYSVLFPSEWPPTPTTTWVRYAYAQGMDLDNMPDAVYVTAPWAKLELRGNADTVTIVPLSTRLEAVDIQGVQPLDETPQAVLAREAAVSAYGLQLTALPQPPNAQTGKPLRSRQRPQRTSAAIRGVSHRGNRSVCD